MLNGNNNAHDTSECKTLQAQAKKLMGTTVALTRMVRATTSPGRIKPRTKPTT